MASGEGLRLELREGWAIQSSAKVDAPGESLSHPGYDTRGWHSARVPTTVIERGALASISPPSRSCVRSHGSYGRPSLRRQAA